LIFAGDSGNKPETPETQIILNTQKMLNTQKIPNTLETPKTPKNRKHGNTENTGNNLFKSLSITFYDKQ